MQCPKSKIDHKYHPCQSVLPVKNLLVTNKKLFAFLQKSDEFIRNNHYISRKGREFYRHSKHNKE